MNHRARIQGPLCTGDNSWHGRQTRDTYIHIHVLHTAHVAAAAWPGGDQSGMTLSNIDFMLSIYERALRDENRANDILQHFHFNFRKVSATFFFSIFQDLVSFSQTQWTLRRTDRFTMQSFTLPARSGFVNYHLV